MLHAEFIMYFFVYLLYDRHTYNNALPIFSVRHVRGLNPYPPPLDRATTHLTFQTNQAARVADGFVK